MRAALGVALALLATGCATAPGMFDQHLAAPAEAERACARWYQALDGAIDAAGVRDAQYARVAGFPYLRADRFTASTRDRAAEGTSAARVFGERLLGLDLEARAVEIQNLPSWNGSRKAALSRTEECGRMLLALDLARPAARQAMLDHARVPDDYSSAARVLGLYPVTSYFFAGGIRRWEAQAREAMARPAGVQEPSGRVRFAPPAQPTLARRAVAGMLERERLDPLGQPVFTEREVELLAATYAPTFEVTVAADYDRFGELRWRRGSATPEVNAAEPAVYVQRAYTRYGERVLLQLVYTVWFPERPKSGTFDLLGGRLDGLVWRVTLAPDGEPLVYDSIHPCGCYHQFFPTPRAHRRPPPSAREEWAFTPAQLPRVAEGERPVVSIDSATHYINKVQLVHGIDSLVRYTQHPYDELRSMMRLEGGMRSAFGPDGLIAGTERAERFLFWPMGIASAGAMRQWGHHATAFVGRRHFDDADLIERRFDIEGLDAGVAQ
jgi:hypothetical protein